MLSVAKVLNQRALQYSVKYLKKTSNPDVSNKGEDYINMINERVFI